MAVNVGSAEGYLDLDISRFLTKLNTAQSAASSMAAKTSMTMNKQLAGVGKSFTSVGKTLTKTVTLPIVGIGAAAVAVTSKFDSAMSKVSAVSGATGKELEKLRDKAKEMGAKTKFSATESAEAFNYMAMAGWKTEDMLEGIEGIMNLAAASGEDLATTSDIVTDALTAFGLEAKDSGHFADVLAANASNANTNVAMLGESFKYVAPVAGALGYSVEDVNLALGLMANSGIKASQAGTTLRGALTRLAKPTDEVQGAMEKYGISLTDAKGNMLPLRDVMGQLREKFSTLSKAEQAQAATTLFGKNAMSGMLAIINSSEKDWNKLANAIDNADGTAERMAETMMDNLGGQVTILKSALEGLAIRIGEVLMPTIKNIVQHVQNFVDKLNKMDDSTLRAIIKIGALVAAIGPLLMIFGKVITLYTSIPGKIAAVTGAFGTLKTAVINVGEAYKLHQAGMVGFAGQTSKLGAGLSSLKGAILGISAPIAAIAAIIAVLVAAFITLWKTNEKFRNAIKGIWNEIKKLFVEFGQSIVDTLNDAGFKFENFKQVIEKVIGFVKKIWMEFCHVLAPVFIAAFKLVRDTIQGVLNVVSGIFRTIMGIIKGDGEMIKSGVKAIVNGAIKIVTAMPKMILRALKGVLDVILGWFGTSTSEIWNGFKNIVNGIVKFFKELPSNIIETMRAMPTKITKFFKDLNVKITKTFEELPDKISEAVKKLPEKIIEFLTSIPKKIKDFFSGKGKKETEESGEQVATAISEGVKKKAEGTDWGSIVKKILLGFGKFVVLFLKLGVDIIKALVKGLWSTVKVLISSIGKLILLALKKFAEFVVGAAKKGLEAGQKFLTNIVNWIKQLPGKLAYWFGYAIGKVALFVMNMVKKAIELGMNFVNTIINFIKQLPGKIWTWCVNTYNRVVQWATNMVNKAREMANNFVNNIINFIKQLPGKVWTWCVTTYNKVVQWATNMVNKGRQMAANFLNTIINFIKQLPGKVWTWCVNTYNKVVQWASQMVAKAKSAGQSFVNNVINYIKQLPGKVWTWLSQTISKAASFVTQFAAKATQAASQFVSRISSGLSGLPGKMASIGSNIVKGLWNGASGMVSWAVGKFKGLGSQILSGIKAALGIKSPSQVFADEVGVPIVQGIAQGMEDNSAQNEVVSAGQKLATRSWTAIKSAFGSNIDELQKQTRDGFKSSWDTMLETQKKAIDKAKKANKAYSNGYKADKKAANKYAKQVYLDYLNSHIKGLKKLKVGSKKWTELVKNNSKVRQNALKAETKARKKSMEQQAKLTKNYNKEVNAIKNNLTKQINAVMSEYTTAVAEERNKLFSAMNPFEAFESTTENTTQSLLANAKAQVDAMQEWNAEMERIEKKVKGQSWASQFMEDLRSAGYDSLADVKVLGEMTNAQWEDFIKLQSQKYAAANVQARQTIDIAPYQAQVKKLMTTAVNDLNKLYDTYAKNMKKYGKTVKNNSVAVGKNLVNGIKSGIKTNQPALFSYVNSLCDNLVKNTKKKLKIKSPSKVFADDVGQWIPLGIAEGVEDAMPQAESEMQEALDNVNLDFDKFDKDINLTQFIESFKSVFDNFGQWFESFETKFILGIQNMTNAIEALSFSVRAIPLSEGGYISANGFMYNHTPSSFRETTRASGIYDGQGDTFNFYSPKAIDEIEAARLLKKTKQDLAEGF